jgi:hypothetical protein
VIMRWPHFIIQKNLAIDHLPAQCRYPPGERLGKKKPPTRRLEGLIRVHLPPMYTSSIKPHRDILKIAKKNRSRASGVRAVNQGASTSYVYGFDQVSPGYFKKE